MAIYDGCTYVVSKQSVLGIAGCETLYTWGFLDLLQNTSSMYLPSGICRHAFLETDITHARVSSLSAKWLDRGHYAGPIWPQSSSKKIIDNLSYKRQ